jgi:hypothetical protein
MRQKAVALATAFSCLSFRLAVLGSADRVQVGGCQAHQLDVRSVRVGHDQVIDGESLGDVLVDTDLESVDVDVRFVILE